MTAVTRLLHRYRSALRDEPKLRAFALASFLDDIGVAASTWASTLLVTNLLIYVGALQVVAVMGLAMLGGRMLWQLGLHEVDEAVPPAPGRTEPSPSLRVSS